MNVSVLPSLIHSNTLLYSEGIRYNNIKSTENTNPTEYVLIEKEEGLKNRNTSFPSSASVNFSKHSSKKLEFVNGVGGADSGQSTCSDKDDKDLFFFDLTGNKSSMDNKNDRNNGFTLSNQEEDKLVRNKVKKHNKSVSDYVNIIGNGGSIDTRDSDCEMTVTTSQHSPSKRKHGMKKQNRSSDDWNQLLLDSFKEQLPKENQKNHSEIRVSQSSSDPCKRAKLKNEQKVEENINDNFSDENRIEGSDLKSGKSKRVIKNQNQKLEKGGKKFSQLPSASIAQYNSMIAENSNHESQEKSIKNSQYQEKKSKTKSQQKVKKETTDFEKSFIETLMEYYQAQSTPLHSEDEDHPQNVSIAKHTQKNSKRKRRNSGDYLNVSSSDENSFNKQNHDQTLKKKSKKRKSAHSFQQIEVPGEILNDEKQNHDQTLKKKSKKKELAHSIQQREVPVDTLNDGIYSSGDICSKYSVIKSELSTPKKKKGTAESNSKEHNYMTDVSEKDKTENVKIGNREESFSIGCYDREDLDNPERREYAKKLKRKKHKSKHVGSTESEMSSLWDVSTNEDSVTRVPKESFMQVPEADSKNIGACDIKQLEVESSGSELDIKYSPSKIEKHKNNNSVHCLSSSEKHENCLKVDIVSPKKVISEKQCIISNGGEISFFQESNDENKLEYRANKGKVTKSHFRSNYIGDEESKNGSVNETGESAPNLKIKSSGKRKKKKKNNSGTDITLVDEQEPEENSYITSKVKKKKKHAENSSLENVSIVDMEPKPMKMECVSPKPDSLEDSSKRTKKKLKKLNSCEVSLEKSPRQKIIDNFMEHNCGIKTSHNEIDGDMKRIENSNKKFRIIIDDSKSNMENYETALSTHEFDETVKEEIDISFTDLKDVNITDTIINDSSEEIRSGNINEINKNIEENLELEDYGAEILKNLHILIPFAIPPLHVNLKRPSKPSIDEIIACKNFKMKLGAFSKEEDQTIRNNWRRFRKEHRLHIEPTAFFKFPPKMPREEKIKFMQYISHGLENRSPHRVYFRFKTLFGNLVKKTGRFTEEEDNQILEYMEEMGLSKTPFTDLAKILNRPSNSIERHFKRLHQQEKLIWTPSKAEELINRMLKVTKLEKPEQLEDSKLTAKQWRKISRKLGGISVIKLQRAWNITIYPRLFATGDIVSTKKKIIDTLHERQETDWRQVDWKEISKQFPGFSPEKLYMMFKKLVIFNVPKHLQKDIKKCVECLREKKIARSHKFRRYVYKNGHLTYESDGDNDDHPDKK